MMEVALDSTGGGDDCHLDYDKELETLTSSVQQAQEKFIGQWTGSNYLNDLQDQQQLVEKRMKMHDDTIAKLNATLEELKGQEQSEKDVQVERATEIQNLQDRLAKIRQETDGLLLEKERFEKEVVELRKVNAHEKELLTAQEQVTDEKLKELQKSVAFFKDKLALQMKKVSGGRMQFVFTCIDVNNPSRPFYFCVRITNRSYEVTDCEPAVQGLEALVKRLNDTNNLKSFVVTIRKRFRDLV